MPDYLNQPPADPLGLIGEIPEFEEEEGSFGGDLALAVPRAAVGLANEVWQTADAITGDRLADWDASGFTQASTGAGQFVTGSLQFAAGFALTGGALKAAGITAKFAKAGKLGEFARNTLQGVATDLFFMDQDSNLSNLLNDAGYGNALTEFLAAEEDDSFAEKKLKGALEGAGIGAVVDVVFQGIRGFRKARALSDPKEREAALRQTAQETAAALEESRVAADPPPPARLEEPEVQAVLEDIGLPSATRQFTLGGVSLQELKDVGSGAVPDAQRLQVNPRDLSAVDRTVLLLDKTDLNLHAYEGNIGATAVTRAYERLFRDAVGKDGVEKHAELLAKSTDELKDILGLTTREGRTWLMRYTEAVKNDKDALAAITARGIAYRRLSQDIYEDFATRFGNVGDLSKASDEALVELTARAEQVGDYMRELRGVISNQGRALASNKIRVRKVGRRTATGDGQAVDAVETALEDVKRTTTDRSDSAAAIRALGGRTKVIEKLRISKEIIEAQGVNGLGNASKHFTRSPGLSLSLEYFLQSILWGPKTHAVNFLSNTVTALYRPLETVVGGIARGDRVVATDALRQLGDTVATFGELVGIGTRARRAEGSEIWRQARKAFTTGESQLIRGSSKLDPRPLGITARNANRMLLGAPEFLSRFLPDKVNTAAEKGFDAFGSLFRTPGKLLQASDEIFKQVTARAQIRNVALKEARRNNLSGADAADYIADRVHQVIVDSELVNTETILKEADAAVKEILSPAAYDDPIAHAEAVGRYITDHQVAINSRLSLSESAAERAQEVTFTTAPEPGTISGAAITSAQQLTGGLPVLRFFLPFIQTPVNILRFASHRAGVDVAIGTVEAIGAKIRKLPLDNVKDLRSRFAKELLSKDPELQADAVGRLVFGMGTVATFGTLAANVYNPDATVYITGKGPGDPNERREWLAAGHQDYAVNLRKEDGTVESFSFARMDPIATIIGTVADLVTYSHFADKEADSTIEGVSAATAMALANNFTNKTYMQGMSDLLVVMQGGGNNFQKIQRVFQKFAGALVPNALGQATGATDPHMREIRSWADAVYSRTPWGAPNLPTRRNILGEPIKRRASWGQDSFGRFMGMVSPFAVSTVKNDPVLEEIVATGHNWSLPGKNQSFGGVEVDLTQFSRPNSSITALDRWQELTATLKNPHTGKNLRASLKELIAKPEYQALQSFGDNDLLDSPKVKALGGVITAFRGYAKIKLLEEYPGIKELVEVQQGQRLEELEEFKKRIGR